VGASEKRKGAEKIVITVMHDSKIAGKPYPARDSSGFAKGNI
jgi:hypothetical protein